MTQQGITLNIVKELSGLEDGLGIILYYEQAGPGLPLGFANKPWEGEAVAVQMLDRTHENWKSVPTPAKRAFTQVVKGFLFLVLDKKLEGKIPGGFEAAWHRGPKCTIQAP